MSGNKKLAVSPDKAGRITFSEGWKGVCGGGEWARLILIENTSGRLHGSRGEVLWQPGDLLLTPACYDFHYIADGSAVELNWCRFRVELEGGDNLFTQWQPNVMHLPAEPEFAVRFQQLLTASAEDSWAAHCRCLEQIYWLLGRFFAVHPPEPAAFFDYRRHLLQPILDRIAAEPELRWEVEELASLLEISKVSCNHLFRDLTGMPPGRWVTMRRVEKSIRLLRNTDEKLESIAARCGFCDAFHFSRVFKQVVGVSPRAFRSGMDAAGSFF